MEIKVGEYIRTEKGRIEKFKNYIQSILFKGNDIETENGIIFIQDDKVIKHSPNIIDLIEVGDFVNGCQVMGIYIPRDTWEPIEVNVDSQTTKYFIKDEIKTIVTKEQFARMEYEVKED